MIAIGSFIKAALVAAALAALVFVTSQAIRSVYNTGFEAGKAVVQVKLDAAEHEAEVERIRYADAIDAAGDAMEELDIEAAARAADLEAKHRSTTRKLEVALNANRAFAALHRPADLQRVRFESFAELEAIAARSAELSGGGLPGLRTTGARGGPDAGDVGAGRPAQPGPVGAVHASP